LIIDSKEITFNIECYKGIVNDSKLLLLHLKNNNLIQLEDIFSKKKYFLADHGYDSKDIRSKLIEMNRAFNCTK
jgi:hypothetical protein